MPYANAGAAPLSVHAGAFGELWEGKARKTRTLARYVVSCKVGAQHVGIRNTGPGRMTDDRRSCKEPIVSHVLCERLRDHCELMHVLLPMSLQLDRTKRQSAYHLHPNESQHLGS